MNLEAYKRQAVEHYVLLCETSDDWKRQAWHSANEFARLYPQVFGDLPDLLTAEMNKRKETQ